MVYLLQDCYKDNNNKYHDILKIGYCKDKDFYSTRGKSYDTHNYGYKLLYSLQNATRDIETSLHKKYRNYLLPESTEWFEYHEEIIDDFKSLFSLIDLTNLGLFKKVIKEIFLNGVIATYKNVVSETGTNELLQDYNFQGMFRGLPFENLEATAIINRFAQKITDSYIEYYKTIDIIGKEIIADNEILLSLNMDTVEKDLRTFSIDFNGIRYIVNYSILWSEPYFKVRRFLEESLEKSYQTVEKQAGSSFLKHNRYGPYNIYSSDCGFMSVDINGEFTCLNQQLVYLARRVIEKFERGMEMYTFFSSVVASKEIIKFIL